SVDWQVANRPARQFSSDIRNRVGWGPTFQIFGLILSEFEDFTLLGWGFADIFSGMKKWTEGACSGRYFETESKRMTDLSAFPDVFFRLRCRILFFAQIESCCRLHFIDFGQMRDETLGVGNLNRQSGTSIGFEQHGAVVGVDDDIH